VDGLVIILFVTVLIIGVSLLLIIALTRKSPPGINKNEFRTKWLAIENSLDGTEPSRHLAILNADKLLDTALKARGFKGETMGERMKSAKKSFRNNNVVWAAHKLRNQIAHEEVNVKPQTTKQALSAFKGALKDLGAL